MPTRNARPLLVSGLLLGCGLGALFDGILLHQILQWHNLLSEVRPPLDLVSMKYNMLWDGVFHAAAWLTTAAGVFQLYRAGRHPEVIWSASSLGGGLLAGWGLFNLFEGVIDHQLLGLHHVRPGEGQMLWDYGFLAWGAAMALAGLAWVGKAPGARSARYGYASR
jgi:uncharacterized membrane protein